MQLQLHGITKNLCDYITIVYICIFVSPEATAQIYPMLLR